MFVEGTRAFELGIQVRSEFEFPAVVYLMGPYGITRAARRLTERHTHETHAPD